MKHFFVTSSQTNPFINLAYEDYMLHHLKEDECLFYLWQNHHTVVIGKNQNAYKECKVEELEASGGYLARRSSGGGAVYHDHGNLNFTFIAPKGFYSLENNLKVIIEACLLSDEQKVIATQAVIDAKADFVKTSTGFSTHGATKEDVALLKSVAKDIIEVKAAGGVRSYEDVLAMLEAGATRIGTSSGVALMQGHKVEGSY